MAKTLADTEMAEIIHRAVHDPNIIDDFDQYKRFLFGLADFITDHFGGVTGNVGGPDFYDRGTPEYDTDAELGWTCGFHVNDSVPSDGGIYIEYDPSILWINGEETTADDIE